MSTYLATQGLSRIRMENMRNGARNNAFHKVVTDLPGGVRLAVEYRPPVNPVTQRIDRKAVREAVAPELMFVWTAERASATTSLIREADILALLDGEALEAVQERRARDAGDPFLAVQKGLGL